MGEMEIEDAELSPAPEWLLARCEKPKAAQSGQGTPRADVIPDELPEGTRDTTIFARIRSLKDQGHKKDEVLALMRVFNGRCNPRLPDDELVRKVDHGFTLPNAPDFKPRDPNIERLAALTPIEFDKVRKAEAKALGVRLDTLDAEVTKARQQHLAAHPQPKQTATWALPAHVVPESVEGTTLVADLKTAIHQFVMLEPLDALIVALWILFTWCFEQIAESNPFLRIVSPTPACGKSTLLKVLKYLARSAWLVSRLSSSAFVRTMELSRRTLLLDEGDAFLNENEIMRNVLDGASDPDTANVSFSVKTGDDWKPAEFNTFVPIVIVSIGMLYRMATVESRAIHVHLKRATPTELKTLSKGRRKELKTILEPLAARCARWAADNVAALQGARPSMPEGLSGRELDLWEPLVALGDAISRQIGNEVRIAAAAASGEKDTDNLPLGVQLLADIRALFEERAADPTATDPDKVSSKALCEALAGIEGRPWAEYGKAQRPISQNQLARLIKPFIIVSHTVRLAGDSTPKGYELRDFEDAFDRYLTDSKNPSTHSFDDSIRHNATTQRAVRRNGDFQSATEGSCGASENGTFPYGENGCGVVADRNADYASGKKFSDMTEAEKDGVREAEIDRLAALDAEGLEREEEGF
jgi:putative DNA primase/helicase